MITNRNEKYLIGLSYNNQQQSFFLPVNPPEIQISDSAGGKTYEVSGLGEINVIQSRKLMDVSFDSFFPAPGSEYPFIVRKDELLDPVFYIQMIRDWMEKKKPIRFVFTGESFDLNIAVSIEKFDWKEVAGSGDIEYSIAFKQYAFYRARPVIVDKNKANTKSDRPADKQKDTTYKLVAGDTLIKVAKKKLGDDSRWREIQKLNGIPDAQLTRLPIGMTLKLPG
ncbi:LysM peptidoglycan-binding domain-containing protein [Paenibacillus sp. NPDC058174]|uniref:LysM peptidoglycan-binding domain-containing protein n=1 Tax=Paenibacillus sp. NPDC058174 TaxID=3346366 RepID=UPI0036D78C20